MSSAVNITVKPQEFFREKITVAAQNQKLEIEPDLEFYLVNLLCDFIAPDKVEAAVGELDALETPMAIILKNAVEAPPSRQLRLFKFLGDSSLYFAGFFQDFFNRKTYDVDYYITLGSSAYNRLSIMMREVHNDEHFCTIYGGLAERFSDFVELVAEVSENPAGQAADLLAIYDRWTRTQSDRLRKVLEKSGITPLTSPISTKQ